MVSPLTTSDDQLKKLYIYGFTGKYINWLYYKKDTRYTIYDDS